VIVLVVQVLGLLLVAAGFAMLAPWAGLIALGLALVLVGLIFEAQEDRTDGSA
jgi:hypothetical protein